MQGAHLVNGAVDLPAFNEQALALRVDQAGETTFRNFRMRPGV